MNTPHSRPAPWRIALAAVRPRTLSLSIATTLAASLVAAVQGRFHGGVFTALLCTTLLLQIFANLANDYGDGLRGADRHRPDAPLRVLAAAWVTPAQMRRLLCFSGSLCLISGLSLIALALPHLSGPTAHAWPWLLAGTAALAAAWFYTAGARPYGYAGWGDAAVWLFFGWVGVLGGALLYGARADLPAAAAANAVGLWCAAVLNINNLRDRDNDAHCGKRTLAVRLDACGGLIYHVCLLILAAASWTVWFVHALPYFLLPLATLVLTLFYIDHIAALHRARQAAGRHEYNRQLAALSHFVLLWVWQHGVALWLM